MFQAVALPVAQVSRWAVALCRQRIISVCSERAWVAGAFFGHEATAFVVHLEHTLIPVTGFKAIFFSLDVSIGDACCPLVLIIIS